MVRKEYHSWDPIKKNHTQIRQSDKLLWKLEWNGGLNGDSMSCKDGKNEIKKII